jgi:hypothetical protein
MGETLAVPFISTQDTQRQQQTISTAATAVVAPAPAPATVAVVEEAAAGAGAGATENEKKEPGLEAVTVTVTTTTPPPPPSSPIAPVHPPGFSPAPPGSSPLAPESGAAATGIALDEFIQQLIQPVPVLGLPLLPPSPPSSRGEAKMETDASESGTAKKEDDDNATTKTRRARHCVSARELAALLADAAGVLDVSPRSRAGIRAATKIRAFALAASSRPAIPPPLPLLLLRRRRRCCCPRRENVVQKY